MSVDWIDFRLIGLNCAAIFLLVLSSLLIRAGAGCGVSGMAPLVQYTWLDLLFNWEKDKYKHLLFDVVGDIPLSIFLIEVVPSVSGVEGVRLAPHVSTRSASKSR